MAASGRSRIERLLGGGAEGCSAATDEQSAGAHWVQCDSCGEWLHFLCARLMCAPTGTFVCVLCEQQEEQREAASELTDRDNRGDDQGGHRANRRGGDETAAVDASGRRAADGAGGQAREQVGAGRVRDRAGSRRVGTQACRPFVSPSLDGPAGPEQQEARGVDAGGGGHVRHASLCPPLGRWRCYREREREREATRLPMLVRLFALSPSLLAPLPASSSCSVACACPNLCPT
eukprot:SAG22_NODE_338_length_12038_cov_24.655583_9_plen_233_part_00